MPATTPPTITTSSLFIALVLAQLSVEIYLARYAVADAGAETNGAAAGAAAARFLWLKIEHLAKAATHFIHEVPRDGAHFAHKVGLVQGHQGCDVGDGVLWEAR